MSRIDIEQFAILSTTILPTDLGLKVDIGFASALNAPVIATKMKFEYVNNDSPIILLEIVCQFEIELESWNSLKNNDKIIVPKDFLAHMAVHTVGTARGILYCKTIGTQFNNIILPPINVSQIIDHDLIVNTEIN